MPGYNAVSKGIPYAFLGSEQFMIFFSQQYILPISEYLQANYIVPFSWKGVFATLWSALLYIPFHSQGHNIIHLINITSVSAWSTLLVLITTPVLCALFVFEQHRLIRTDEINPEYIRFLSLYGMTKRTRIAIVRDLSSKANIAAHSR